MTAPFFGNRARMLTSTTGTGTITLDSAVAGYQTFADSGIADQSQVYFGIEDGTDWEVSWGIYTSSGTSLTRNLIESSTGSLLNLSGSDVQVFIAGSVEGFRHQSLMARALFVASGY